MKKTPIVIILALTFMPVANAVEIASKAYVDNKENMLLYGTTNPSSSRVDNFNTLVEDHGGSLASVLDGMLQYTDPGFMDELGERAGSGVNTYQVTPNALIVTNSDGQVAKATGGYITNDKISSNAAIEMGKIAYPTPPEICETTGCMLMYYNGKYVWESVSRENNETISTTGYVNADATTTSVDITEVESSERGHGSDGEYDL